MTYEIKIITEMGEIHVQQVIKEIRKYYPIKSISYIEVKR